MTKPNQQTVWHPFTQMRDWCDTPQLMIERAEGNYLIDDKGNYYLDGVSSLWVNVHGHHHRELDDAIRQQLDRVAHSTLLGLANGPATELANMLTEITPMSKVFYSDSGSTAVEIALKQAFQYWQHCKRPSKQAFVHLKEAYHGDTIGAVSVGGIDIFHELFHPLLFDSIAMPSPALCRHPRDLLPEQIVERCIRSVAALFERDADQIAAMIVEPLVQGAAGMLVHARGYLSALADLCRQYEVLLIVDEVATGFGRTGKMFAIDHEQVRPDFLCLAKGITGGYLPLAATLTTDKVYEAFLGNRRDYKTFFHGHTYTGNPLACAVAIASLNIFDRENTLTTVTGKVSALSTLLQTHLSNHSAVTEVRQCGLMVGVELRGDDPAVGAQVCEAVRQRGVILRPLGNVIVLMPPLSITHNELSDLVRTTSEAIDEVVS